MEGQLIPPMETLQSMEWWAYLGGVLGIFVVLSAILIFPRIGAVQTVAIPIFGQMIMGLLIDYFGLFGIDAIPLSPINLLGVVILSIGLLLAVVLPDYFEKKQLERVENNGITGINKLFWQLIALISGFCMAIQPAINGHLGVGISSSVQAALISFFIGTALLILINIILGELPNIKHVFTEKAPWWFYLGGFLGALYVFFSIILTPEIGAGAFVILGLIGQMIISLLIDNFGLLGSKKRKVSMIQIIGLMVILAGAVIIKLL